MKLQFLHYPNLTLDDAPRGAVVAVGTFDGVHAGHRRLVERAQALASARGAASGVFTFVEHPRSILRPDHPVSLLTPWPEKVERLGALGLDACIAAHFTPDLALLSPDAFVKRILVDQLGVSAIVTGFNFHFGHGQAGNPAVLKALGETYGFPVEIVPPVEADGGVISSTRLRELLATGHIEAANGILGYDYTLSGTVIHGDKRGRTIGFPTANMDLPREKLLPAYGVYACWATVGGERIPAIVNIGQRPTFDPPKLMIEAHLFDWAGEIYGETISVSLIQRIRSEQAFPSVAALITQITADCLRARIMLGAEVPT